jgi:hypothetical protein
MLDAFLARFDPGLGSQINELMADPSLNQPLKMKLAGKQVAAFSRKVA